MGKIKILSDKSGTYEVGGIILQIDFLSKYFKAFPNDPHIGWMQRVPMPAAIDSVAEKLGIEYEYVA